MEQWHEERSGAVSGLLPKGDHVKITDKHEGVYRSYFRSMYRQPSLVHDILGSKKKGVSGMIYVVGIIGFISGFALGLKIIGYLLKERSSEDLLQDKSLRMTYGLLAWGVAGLTAFCAIQAYKIYFHG